MSSPNSPHRSRGGNSDGEERPRNFDRRAKGKCWENSQTVPGRHPERWRKDAAGNVVCKRFCNCHGCLCFEYDHIVPYSKGGESTAENCQILQTRVNRFKSDKDYVDATQLKGYSCDIKFTGTFPLLRACEDHDVILIPYISRYCLRIFLQKRKDSLNQAVEACTTSELLAVFIPYTPKDKELDIIEMAVYGDVIRPGNQCRCRTFAEMLGQYKSKDQMAACKLPYNDESL